MASGGGESRRSDTEPAMDWRREDGLRAFGFAELKSAMRGFSRSLIIGEGGFGCVYRAVVSVPQQGDDGAKTMDVAVKQLNRNGHQVEYTAYRDKEGRLLSVDSVSYVGEYTQERIPVEKATKAGDFHVLKDDPSIRLISRSSK